MPPRVIKDPIPVGKEARYSARRREIIASIKRGDYATPRDLYIHYRQPLPLSIIGEIFGMAGPSIHIQREKDRGGPLDWDKLRANHWRSVDLEARQLVVQQVARDEASRQTLYRQFCSSVFTVAQKWITKLAEAERQAPVDPTADATPVLNLQRLQKIGSDCWNFEERVFGIPALRDAMHAHVADLRAVREVIERSLGDEPEKLGAIRLELEKIITRRNDEDTDAILDRQRMLEEEDEMLAEMAKQEEAVEDFEGEAPKKRRRRRARRRIEG